VLSTKGPWEVGGVSTVSLVDEDPGEKVAMVICAEGERTPVLAWVPVGDDTKESMANANLMAMAPKMLALFQDMATMPDNKLTPDLIRWYAKWVINSLERSNSGI
jgi:hypothetical protein